MSEKSQARVSRHLHVVACSLVAAAFGCNVDTFDGAPSEYPDIRAAEQMVAMPQFEYRRVDAASHVVGTPSTAPECLEEFLQIAPDLVLESFYHRCQSWDTGTLVAVDAMVEYFGEYYDEESGALDLHAASSITNEGQQAWEVSSEASIGHTYQFIRDTVGYLNIVVTGRAWTDGRPFTALEILVDGQPALALGPESDGINHVVVPVAALVPITLEVRGHGGAGTDNYKANERIARSFDYHIEWYTSDQP